jgi:galactonate dehydratase
MPEDPLEHGRLAAAIETPLALGESYRSVFELRPFFDAAGVTYVQPDLGRCGLTEGMRIADLVWEMDKPLAPHISIALGRRSRRPSTTRGVRPCDLPSTIRR